ncbi:YIP1 family protein [Vitiosangium sp. GDMCC 1.1324]|uniref:YIP1 family protein n=1 Tax=Vitiosangium sp. (strain GDMCC 1.1324) TaxID=2138576 RepID=UPI000D3CF6C5|nr:YIP1 family protein [Vitiosangium sp. GDMCC 1.1324]PTL79542.1 hypothetical protein DAT35_32525 [Vitiosangium sp. GDMCC 1.1324]
MSSPREQILEMVASGKLTAAEGDQLLASIGQPRPSVWRWMFDPLSCLRTRMALAVSAAFAAVSLGLTRLGLRFDGALDVHANAGVLSWPVALAEVALVWPVTAAVFWAVARLLGRRTARWVDVLGAVGLARVPLVLSGVVVAVLAPAESPRELSPQVIALAILSLPLIGWSIAALVLGFRTATGLKGARWVSGFLVALIVAEVLSKVVLYRLG